MIDSNMADLLKNISITQLDPYRKIVKNLKTGAYIICNNSTNEVESKGVINPNPNPEYQLQKASEQRTNNIDNSFALEMYGLVNLCSGRSDIYDNIQQTMTTAYPSHRYQMGSEQRNNYNNNNNNRNAIEMYELVRTISNYFS